MADDVTVEQESGSSFAPYFGMYHGLLRFDYDNLSSSKQRMLAVACALEIIKGQGSIDHHMDNLSTYADQIQDALNVRK
ncbi:hypothetical protein ACET9K_02885 [Aeromonas enteropelogenes]|uniref:hypothetical protein n=1 Tax=Aeromonas enteropelogenes TaxID=29489 RepID=UPI0038D1ED8A